MSKPELEEKILKAIKEYEKEHEDKLVDGVTLLHSVFNTDGAINKKHTDGVDCTILQTK